MLSIKSIIGLMRAAVRERFIVPHYHCFTRMNRGVEKRVILPNCELDSEFMADPFLVRRDGTNWLFFEGLYKNRGNRGRAKGVIGCLRQIDGGWQYCGIALEEPWHLSFPHVFEADEHLYMIPEAGQSGAVSLYECIEFPLKWSKVCDLIVGDCNYVDAALVHDGNAYYIVVTPASEPARPELWVAGSLRGPWARHPQSNNVSSSLALRRNGGAFVRDEGRLFRIAQDCDGGYGVSLYRVPITKINREQYEEGTAEELSSKIDWQQPMPHHTYNRIAYEESVLEVVDRHFYTIKRGIPFVAALFMYLVDGLCCLAKRQFPSNG